MTAVWFSTVALLRFVASLVAAKNLLKACQHDGLGHSIKGLELTESQNVLDLPLSLVRFQCVLMDDLPSKALAFSIQPYPLLYRLLPIVKI